MKVFEFHFNPKIKPNLIFDSFCYEPENIYEKRVGNLFMVGILKNALPRNQRLIENLAQRIKREYYRVVHLNPKKAFKEALEEANNFLEEIAKRGDVSWLGNLSFLAMSLKDFKWFFSKIGEIKIFLLRGGKAVDIEKKVKLEEIEPYPLRVFASSVSGKLAQGDAVLVLTKEIFDFFEKENLFSHLAKFEKLNGKDLKEIFERKKEEVLKLSGIILMISLVKEVLPKKRETFLKKISPFEIKLKKFSLPILNRIQKLKKVFKIPQIKLPTLKLNKKLIPILGLVFVLAFGYLFARIQEKREIKNYQRILNQIQEKVNEAESFLILKDPKLDRKANILLKESLKEISPLVKISKTLPEDFENKILALNDEILKNLFELNKIEISEPELIFEFDFKEFVPQRMESCGENLYFFNPFSKKIFKLREKEIFQIEKEPNFATNFNEQILFFSKKDLSIFSANGERFSAILKTPYLDFEPIDFSVFRKNLYFLDKKAGRIVKYDWKGNFEWGDPKIRIENENLIGAEGMAIDGAIWILKADNKILKIYAGKIEKGIDLEIFPEKKDFTKIFTLPDLPYLFILEPLQKRIIVLEKTGQIKKQFQSEKFDNLLDFSVSEDGKEIWLLNGLRVYKIKF